MDPECTSPGWPSLIDQAWSFNFERPEVGEWCDAHCTYHPPEALRQFALRLLDLNPLLAQHG